MVQFQRPRRYKADRRFIVGVRYDARDVLPGYGTGEAFDPSRQQAVPMEEEVPQRQAFDYFSQDNSQFSQVRVCIG